MEPYIITRVGLDKIRARIRQIKEVDRPQNVREIEIAREHGDLRENAEYHAAKERQSFLEGELRTLENKSSRAQVIDPATQTGTRVIFGATVTMLDLDTDEESTYRIIGEDEADLKLGSISYKSPIAQALIGKDEGDEVVVVTPGGKRKVEIVEVRFE